MDANVHSDCNRIVRSLALPHICHATLLHMLLHFHTYVMLRCCTFSCTSTHTSCYAAAHFLALPIYVMLRCCTFSCTSTRTSCYAAARSFALPHMCHAMLLHVPMHFHTYVMLRARTACYADGCKAWKGASKQQVPEKRLKWQNVAHNRSEFVKHLGRKPTKKSSSLAGTDFRQTVGQTNWKYLYAAVWRKSVKGNVLNNRGQLCV